MIFHITTVHKNIQLGSQLMPLRQLKVKKQYQMGKISSLLKIHLFFIFSS